MSDARQALLGGAGVVDLRALGTIRCSGEDRLRFLHGQLTADVKALTPGGGCYSFQLDEKGGILADLRMIARADDLLMTCDAGDCLVGVGTSLAGFVIADRVDLEDYTEDRVWVGLEGPRAAEVFARVCGVEAPSGDYGQVDVGQPVPALAVRLERDSWTGLPAIWFWLAPGDREALVGALTADEAVVVDASTVERVRVERGVFRHGVDFGGPQRALVQETGLLHAVSFTKGCYRGQETVERVRSRGAVNRTLGGLRIDGAPPAPGTPIEADDAKRPVGAITSAVATPAGTLALGYVRRQYAGAGTTLRVGEATATVANLPFAED